MNCCASAVVAMVLGLLAGTAVAEVTVPVASTTCHNNNANYGGDMSDMTSGSGMSQPDLTDPSTWAATGTSYPDEWPGKYQLAGGINGKIGWAAFDLGSTVNSLENLYIWGGRENTTVGWKDYNVYYATSPTVLLPDAPTGSTPTDYDFSSGGWTLLNSAGVLTLPVRGAAPAPADAVVSLGGVSARYIAMEAKSTHGATTRTALAEIGITKSDAPSFLPSSLSVSDVAGDAATFNVDLWVDRTNADVYVYWNTVDGGTNVADWTNSAYVGNYSTAGETNVSVSFTTNGLSATRSYYYTFSASNSTEVKWVEPSGSFLSGGAVLIENDGHVAKNGYATLNGGLQADNGSPTTVRVYWGTSDSGTNAANWANTNTLSGTQPVGALTADTASGLLYGVPYYFRYYATNATGEAWASTTDSFFTDVPVPVPPTADLEAWYDASVGVSVNGSSVVTNWTDRSSNGRDLVPDAGTPTLVAGEVNGLPAVNFNADGEGLQMANPANEYFAKETWLAFRSGNGTKFRGWSTPFGVPDGDDADRMWMFENNQARFWTTEAPEAVTRNGEDIPANDGNFDMSLSAGGDDMGQFMVLRVVTGAGSGTQVRPHILGTRNDTWASGRYVTAELLAYNSVNSAADQQVIGAYLAQKYGIETTYPAYLSISNLPVSPGMTSTSATVNASFRALGAAFDVYVYWGTTDGGTIPGSWGHTNFVGSYTNVDTTTLSLGLDSLAAGTEYHYAFCAQNAATNMWAQPSGRFDTMGVPVASTLSGATRIRSGAAQLTGALSAGGAADVTICWGDVNAGTSGGPAAWQHVETVGSAYQQAPFSVEVSETLYGVRYYYAVFASNDFGTGWSTVASFTTERPIPMLVTSGLEGWYDAAYGVTTSGGNVTSWLDKSGNGHHTTSVVGTPTFATDEANHWPTVKFHGGNNRLNINHAMVPQEEYIVFRSGRYAYDAFNPALFGPDWGGPFGQQNNDGWMLESGQTRTWNQAANVPLAMAQNGTDLPNVGGQYYMANVGDYFILKVNPQQYGSADCMIGRPNNSWGNGYVDVAEVLVFNTPLSEEDEDKVGGYLAQKYGISSAYPALPVPAVENTRITGLIGGDATLNGTLYAVDSVYEVWVYWSTNNGVASKAAWLAGTGDRQYMGTFTNVASTNLSHGLSGLPALTTYYYNFYASNAVEEIWGDSYVFGTAGPPTVENRGVAGLDAATASMQGELTQGGFADIVVCWGTSDAGTNSGTSAWEHVDDMGSRGVGQVFADMVTDAYYGVTYSYRCYATNSLGSDWSDTATSFTTPMPEGDVQVLPVTNNLEAWYDAGHGLSLSGSSVTEWADKSGNDKHTTLVSGTPEFMSSDINERPAIKFRGEHFEVDHAIIPREEYIVFRSGRYDSDVNPHLWYADWGGPFGQQNDNGWMLENNQRRTWNSRIPVAMKQNGTNATFSGNQYYFNQVGDYMVLKVNPLNYASDDAYIGRPNNSWGAGHLDIAEVIVYSATNTVADEQSIGAYLEWKYGIDTTYGAFSPPNAASIVNVAVTDVALGQARLNAAIDCTDAIYHVTAFWSTNDYTTNAADWVANGDSAYVGALTNVAGSIGYLVPAGIVSDTEYFYTFRGTNEFAEIWAEPSMSFRSVGAPSVTNRGVVQIGVGAATLQGEVTDGGGADLFMCWGASDGGTNDVADWEFSSAMGRVTEGVVVTDAATDVYYGIEYQFRVFASNALGTAWSGVTNFATLPPVGTVVGVLNWDFETGDLTGWTNVGTTAGADTVFRGGNNPVSHTRVGPKQGTYYVDCYQSNEGSGDGWTGVIESDSFTLGANARLTMVSGGGTFSWSGTPASPGTFAGTALERKVSPGTWENVIFQSGGANALVARDHDLSAYEGDTMRLRIYDTMTGGWGWTAVDDIEVTNVVLFGGPSISIANTAATNIRATAADLVGALDAPQSVFTVYAYYSTNDNADAVAWSADAEAGNVTIGTFTNVIGQTVIGTATGLLADTTYFYALVATNASTNIWAAPNASFVSDRPPVLLALGPTNDATGVEPNENLVATFDEAIALVSGGMVTISNLTEGTAATITIADAQLSVAGGSNLVINPSLNLDADDTYAVLIDGHAVGDLNGDTWAGISENTAWRFTIRSAEGVPPQIVSLDPTTAAVDVPITHRLVATFDENVEVIPGGEVSLTNITAGTVTNIALPDSQVTVFNEELRIDLVPQFEFGDTYAVLISGDAFEDAWGNNFGGVATTSVWSFTTEFEPVIALLSPTNNATGVPLADNLVATFNKGVVLVEGGTITLKNLTDASQTTFTIPDGQVSVAGAVVTINPTDDLGLADQYAVRISADAIDDLNGNSFAGISDDVTWAFQGTTAATAIYIGPSSNNDTWNAAANWDIVTVPDGAMNAVIPEGKKATAIGAGTPTYIGDLTIGTNATLQIGWAGRIAESENAFGTPGFTTIHMYDGAYINTRNAGAPSMPAIRLMGNASMCAGQSTQTGADPTFGHGISGAYTFTLKGKGDVEYYFTASNSFAHLVADGQYGRSFDLLAEAKHSLGTGDVTIPAYSDDLVTANLIVNATNAMADAATLSISGPGSVTKLTMNADDTIGGLVVDGVRQAIGSYGSVGNGAVDYEVSWIAGDGVLTVAAPPSGYWDLNGADAGAGGASPTGVWDASGTNWNMSSAGTNVTTAWGSGETAVFAAGTDATGVYAVTIDGTQTVNGLAVEEGAVTLSGDALKMIADSPIVVVSGLTATVVAPIEDDGDGWRLSKSGDGTLVLGATNAYAGVTRVEGGVLSVSDLQGAGAASSIGSYASAGNGGLELAAGTLQYTGGSTNVDRGFTIKGDSTIDLSADDTELTLGTCAVADLSGTLTVTGGAGSRLSLGQFRIIEGMSAGFNPIGVSMTVDSVRGDTHYPRFGGTVTLAGTSVSNVIAGSFTKENYQWAPNPNVVKSGASAWTIQGALGSVGNVTVNSGKLTLLDPGSGYGGLLSVSGGALSVPVVNDNGASGPLGRDADPAILGGALQAGTLQYTGSTNVCTRKFTLATSGTGVFEVANESTVLTLSGTIDGNGELLKTGPGELVLAGANTYTGSTTVAVGTLSLTNSTALSDSAALWVVPGAMVHLAHGVNEVVTNLYLNGVVQPRGTWGSRSSSASYKNNSYFSGTGVLTVVAGPDRKTILIIR